MEKQKIYIVEKNTIARESLRLYLEHILKHTVIGEATSGKECMEDERAVFADVVLMDCEMPLNGAFIAAKSLKYENQKVKIIAMSIHTEQPYLKDLLFAGFSGCVFKQNIFELLEKTIAQVTKNKLEFPKSMLSY